ncbi:MAG: hypothetical protein WC527_08090 [Candidatus Margulisiibacteriota bacterium]
MSKVTHAILIVFLLFSTSFAATQSVTNTLDSGAGSFRQALVDANNGDTIAFNISSAGAGVSTGEAYSGWVSNEVTGYRWFRIVLNEALVVVKNNLIIDGTTCTTSDVTSPTGGPVIEIVAPVSNAVTLEGSGNTIKGFCINTSNYAIYCLGANNTIIGNYIGMNVPGESLTSNVSVAGILVSAEGTTIGGSTAAERNVISGCSAIAIQTILNGSNTIKGNYIGLTASGEGVLPTMYGIMIGGGTGNIVGGLNPGEGNVISGCTLEGSFIGGLSIYGMFTNESTCIYGNYIGTNASGTRALPNCTGVTLLGFDKNTKIGNGTSAGRNIISGNTLADLILIGLSDITIESTTIYGNYIGTDKNGSAALSSNLASVLIVDQVSGTSLGGSVPGQGNVISGNSTGYGILVSAILSVSSPTNNQIAGNLIGVAADGISALGNKVGVYLSEYSLDNTIGTGSLAGSNIIAYNTECGITLEGAGVNFNKITCNSIYGNTNKGISLMDGANSGIGIATISSVISDGVSVTISGTSLASAVIEVFKAAGDQGKSYLGTINADAAGAWSGIVPVAVGMVTGDAVTVTQTDANNNTSEFSITMEAIIVAPVVRSLSVTLPSTSVASGAAFSATITAKDAAGNTVTTLYIPTTVTVDAGTVTPSSIEASEFVSGVWSGNLTLHKPGGRTLYFSYGAAAGTGNILVTSQTTTRIMFGPNPFNPNNGSGVIWYYLDADNETSVYLLDLSGTVVWKATYPSGAVGGKAGANSITYDGKTLWGDVLGNGVYIYKVVQGNRSVGGGKIAVIK